jgi:predicted DNA-binding transcriptional regulator AlpA
MDQPSRHNPLAAVPTLEALAEDPAQIDALPAPVVVALWATADQLARRLMLRLMTAPPPATEDRLLGVEEAAAILGKTVDWLYRHHDALPFTVREGRLVRFSKNGIQRYIEARCRQR